MLCRTWIPFLTSIRSGAPRSASASLPAKTYHKEHAWDVSIRIITDHIRSATFMISDGILPSNAGSGYVLRRIIRRAARHGRMLGIEGDFWQNLSSDRDRREAGTVIRSWKEKQDFIFNVLTQEEKKFGRTIDQGLAIHFVAEMQTKMAARRGTSTVMDGEDAFKPLRYLRLPDRPDKGDSRREKGFTIDEDGFNAGDAEAEERWHRKPIR